MFLKKFFFQYIKENLQSAVSGQKQLLNSMFP